jgi:hypothetical protein
MGKATKFRNCPAVGREIAAVECGRNRGVVYNCPSDCPYCPWTPENYDDFLEIEQAVDRETNGFYRSVAGSRDNIRNAINRIMDGDGDEDEKSMQLNSLFYREYLIRDFGNGKKLFDLWRESGWKGLSRDEPFIASHKISTRVSLLEVRRVVDRQIVECVDLFSDKQEPVICCDRGLASNAAPFDTLLAWICRYPFFHRVHGIARPLPNSVESSRDRVLKAVEKLGGPSKQGPEWNDWLGIHLNEVADEIGREEKKRMLSAARNSDFKECVAVYRWRAGFSKLDLEGRCDFVWQPEDSNTRAKSGPHENHVWLRTGESAKWEEKLPKAHRSIPGVPGEPIWGHLHVYPDRVEVLAVSETLFRPMREMTEEFFGRALVFEKEFVADLAKQKFSDGEDKQHQGVILASNFFREKPDVKEVLKQTINAKLRHTLGEQIPALGGITPREAAQSPESRPILIDWMKAYLSSLESLGKQNGVVLDIDWALDELGLGELKVPRSRREILESEGGWWREVQADEIEEALLGGGSLERPDLGVFPEVEEYFDSIDKKLLKKGDLDALLYHADFAVGVLVPVGIEPKVISHGDIRAEFMALLDEISSQALQFMANDSEMDDIDSAVSLLEGVLKRSCQPKLLMSLAAMLAAYAESDAKKGKIRKEARFPILLQLEALMRCIRRVAV